VSTCSIYSFAERVSTRASDSRKCSCSRQCAHSAENIRASTHREYSQRVLAPVWNGPNSEKRHIKGRPTTSDTVRPTSHYLLRRTKQFTPIVTRR